MKICHPKVQEAFDKVCTRNGWPSKQKVWFDGYDGHVAGEDGKSGFQFHLDTALGQNGVHRAHLLDELVKSFPAEKASFGKRLQKYTQNPDEVKVSPVIWKRDSATSLAVISTSRPIVSENPCPDDVGLHISRNKTKAQPCADLDSGLISRRCNLASDHHQSAVSESRAHYH